MRHAIRRCLALSLLLAAAPVRGENVSPSATQPSRATYQTLERLADALRDRSRLALDSLFTADHVTHAFRDGPVRFAAGRTHDAALDSLAALLAGDSRVNVFLDGLSEEADPEHPDSLEHYRLVTVRRFDLRRAAGDTLLRGLHVLHLVRGDAAVRAHGPLDPRRWYVRRWLMDLSLARRELSMPRVGPRGPGTVPASLPVSDRQAAAGTVRVEVLDVQGRSVQRLERDLPAGPFTVEAGSGATLVPGVYWVRLERGGAAPATRLVLVGR